MKLSHICGWGKKRILTLLLTGGLALGMTGCGASIGTNGGSVTTQELFPEQTQETTGAVSKTSEVGYKFSVGGEEIEVYVDTTNGHSFEVVNSPAGFKIKNSDGTDALYAACLEREKYEELTTYVTEVKTINGRDFLYSKNGDGSEDCFTYLADCGMDLGLVLEVHDGKNENFNLVAFRGEALEGASSDVNYYKGKTDSSGLFDSEDAGTAEVVTTEAETTDTGATESTASGGSDLNTGSGNNSEDIQKIMANLGSDYNNIHWGVVYQIHEDFPGVVISCTVTRRFGQYELIVAITNLYNTPISFSATAAAKGSGDTVLGDTFIYENCIGSGNTMIETIGCGEEMPDGRIQWSDVKVDESFYGYARWEADHQVSGNPKDGSLKAEYSLYTADGSACKGTSVTFLLTDENGFVVGIGTDYSEDIPANGKYTGSANIYGEEELLATTKGISMFANTSKEK